MASEKKELTAEELAKKHVVEAGIAVGMAAGAAASAAAATAVAASVTPVVTSVFAGVVFTSGGTVAAGPLLVALAANPVGAAALGAAALAVAGARLAKKLVR
jgi:hypothetical protein